MMEGLRVEHEAGGLTPTEALQRLFYVYCTVLTRAENVLKYIGEAFNKNKNKKEFVV